MVSLGCYKAHIIPLVIPHAPDRYTGGSSWGPVAIVASRLCSAALGTDGGGCANLMY